MTTYIREWTTIDKTTWGPGPWQAEPDKVHWIDQATDMDCLMVRNAHTGHWCGYVAVTEGHPRFGVGYDGCAERRQDADGEPERWCAHAVDADVHGGLTFSDFCAESDDPAVGICHVPAPGRPDRVWWFGFDCHHGGDVAPGLSALYAEFALLDRRARYRDRAFVEREVTGLARQLRAVAKAEATTVTDPAVHRPPIAARSFPRAAERG